MADENETASLMDDGYGENYREPTETEKRILLAHHEWAESKTKEGEEEKGERADLTGADLRGLDFESVSPRDLDFKGINLEGIVLADANLSGAFLPRINLRHAYLQNTNFENANFYEHEKTLYSKGFDPKNHIGKTDLQEARLWRANLRNANLTGAALQKAEIFEADLKGANLSSAFLQETDLRSSNLQDASLRDSKAENVKLGRANLNSADLSDANLSQADLGEANLEGADLSRTKLQNANLLDASLRGANLQDANLTNATGVLASQLALCNVSGAEFPETIKNLEDPLEIVKETSMSAKKIFLAMLLACVYSLLTIFSTGDEKLITNSSSSPLPIIQVGVPIADFYLVAPIVLLVIFIYFHLYLQNMWHHLSKLPAVFLDGTPLQDKAYPWLLTQRVRAHFPLLKENSLLSLSRFQGFVSILLAWWAVPVTIAVFWLWYLRTHDWTYIRSHIFFLTVSVMCAAYFQRLARNTLRHNTPPPGLVKKIIRLCAAAAAGAILAALMTLFTQKLITDNPGFWFPRALRLIGSSANLDVSDKDVSPKPPHWARDRALWALVKRTNENTSAPPAAGKAITAFELVSGANLKGKNLNNLRANGAFIANADIRSASLRNAQFLNATLHGADLRSANLEGAYLEKADLKGAKLYNSRLTGANFKRANLLRADLWGANLLGTDFHQANLKGADMEDAENSTQDQFNWACVDSTTKLPPDIKRQETYPGCDYWKEKEK